MKKRSRLNDLEKRLIIELYDKTKNINYMSQATGLERHTLSRVLKDEMVDTSACHKRNYVLAKEILDDIFYGKDLETIMQDRGTTELDINELMEYYIRSSKEKLNMNVRKISKDVTKIETEEMIDKLNNGSTITSLAKEYGITVSGISKRLKRYYNKWGNKNEQL